MKLPGLCLGSKVHQKDGLQNRSDETAGNNNSLTNLRDTMSNHRGKWVYNTLGFFTLYILRSLSIFCLKVFCKFQEIYPQTDTQRNAWKCLLNIGFTSDWKRVHFWHELFPLPKNTSSSFLVLVFNLQQVLETLQKQKRSYQSTTITDTGSVLSQVHASSHWA